MTVLVTGGGGFLGRYICKALREQGFGVRSASRKHYNYLNEMGAEQICCDLSNIQEVRNALAGCDKVIHTAAKTGIWGRKEDFFQANVIGTKNLLSSMIEQNIKYLIYTSSPSVVYADKDICGADERIAYPKYHSTFYSYTKKLAEEEILANQMNINVIILRPPLIWGPHDPHFLPRILSKAKNKRLARIGNENNLVDVTYVENAATAHVKALIALVNNPQLNGNAYFLGQERPVNLWDFIDQLLACGGEKPLQKKIAKSSAYILGWLFENVYKTFNIYNKEPPLTRFLVKQLTTSRYFSHKKAYDDFGYQPQISIEQGLAKLAHFCL